MKRRLREILLWADTPPTRLTVALFDIFFMLYLLTPQSQDDTVFMLSAFNSAHGLMIWLLLLSLHALSLLHGLTGKFNYGTLLLEGFVGLFIWGIIAVTNAVAQGGIPGPSAVVLAMQVWIISRYPTHLRGRRD